MEMDLIEHNDKVIHELANKLSIDLKKIIVTSNIFEALFMLWGDKNEWLWAAELWDLKIDFNKAYDELKEFDFDIFDNEVYTEYELIKDIILYEKKALIKSSGVVWKIHRYDPDPFPSNPHAHQIEENIKLDLSNGDCYRAKKFLKTIPQKELLKIREQATKKFKGQLPELAI